MTDRSKGGGNTKCSLWSSRLEVGREDNKPTPETYTATKPAEPTEEVQDPHRVLVPVKMKKTFI
jgi:hypothetical protein